MIPTPRLYRTVITIASIFLVSACADESPLPSIDELSAGWNQLFPGGETVCSDSSAYTFFVRVASRDSLMIHFQGGGACWLGQNCSQDHEPSFTPTADEDDNPSGDAGIWETDNPENPFANYSQVLVPYCTGDVHLGDRVTTYEVPATDSTPATQVTIPHKGYVNAMAVLDWVFDVFDAPQTVFVNGTSAGSVPAALYGAIVQERYPNAYVVALGDASATYRAGDLTDVWDVWGTVDVLARHAGYEGVTAGELALETMFHVAAQQHPQLRLAQYTTADDAVQLSFLRMLGVTETPQVVLLDSNEAAIRSEVPTYRSFIAGGTSHGILGGSGFFYYEADGRRVRDWVADLAAGRDPGDVRCADCDRPSFHFTKTDLEIVERANALLSAVSAWHQEEDWECEDDDTNQRWSLFCAVHRASRDVLGDFTRTAVLAEVPYAIREVALDHQFGAVLRDFNNAPDTSFDDVKRVLGIVIDRVEARLEGS
jgi:hypothetical protein